RKTDFGFLGLWVGKFIPQYDPPTTETLAILYALRCEKRLAFNKLVVESDAWVIVEAINSPSSCDTSYGNIIENIKELTMSFESCFVRYVGRDDKLAHVTASRARDFAD
ncbi:RVT_3 domain-containing protein, partial [Cephalotus follicularis]